MGTILVDQTKSAGHTPAKLAQTRSPSKTPINLGTHSPEGRTHTPDIVIRTPVEFDILSYQPHEEGLTVHPAMSQPPPPGVNLPPGQAAYGKIKGELFVGFLRQLALF
jgi:hypothetical protein